MKRKLITFVLLQSTFYNLLFTASPVGALTMSNSNYKLQMENLNTAAGKSTGTNKKLSLTVGESAIGKYTNSNFTVESGFQYIYPFKKSTSSTFQFTVSDTTIDFGKLSPANPVTRTSTLTITTGNATGYTVTTSENKPLTAAASSAFIPDTTCDLGTCSESQSGIWDSILTYGFGYRCDNQIATDCAIGFLQTSSYKQFADASKSETTQSIMTGSGQSSTKSSKVTYKVNISSSQLPGIYKNTITYIAAPTF